MMGDRTASRGEQVRRNVVVGVDGSENALRAVRWGAAEAGRRRIPLRLVAAFAWPIEHGAVRPGSDERHRDLLLDQARHDLVGAALVAHREVAHLEVDQQLTVGHPLSVLDEEADHAHVVVIGDRGQSRVDGLLAGSVAVALAVRASSPVVVVRGPERDTAGLPVLVGVDGADEAAIGFAFEAASTRGVELIVLHTWSEWKLDPVVAPMLDWPAIEVDEQQLLSDRLAGWAQKFPDTPVVRVLTRDRPAHSLLVQAAAAQLLVVGSRGRGPLSGLVLGSVSHALLHRSPCPVAIVRPDAA